MIFLKPGGRRRRLAFAAQQILDGFAEGGVDQNAFEFILRGRLQHHPGVLREFPQGGIQLAPHFVGGVIPRPAQVQRQFRQRIETFHIFGKWTIGRRTVGDGIGHGNIFHFGPDGVPGGSGDAAKAVLTMVWASA